jgi:hypothetical protein
MEEYFDKLVQVFQGANETPALSNVVRARLLLGSGGVWVDSTLFPMQPLNAVLALPVQTNNKLASRLIHNRPGPVCCSECLVKVRYVAARRLHAER